MMATDSKLCLTTNTVVTLLRHSRLISIETSDSVMQKNYYVFIVLNQLQSSSASSFLSELIFQNCIFF